jgi:hypothetical protein
MARDDLHFRLRIPEELKGAVEKAASDNRRSMTAEIVARLEQSFVDKIFRLESESVYNEGSRAERRQIRELQERYFESLARENEALKRAGTVNDHIIFQFASAIMKAAQGDRSELERLVEQEKAQPVLKRMVTLSSVVRDE